MMVYDAPEGENSFRYQIAFDLQSNGNYLSLSPVYEVPGLGHDGDGAGVAVGEFSGFKEPCTPTAGSPPIVK